MKKLVEALRVYTRFNINNHFPMELSHDEI